MDYTLNCNGQLFELKTPQVMGILNVTPDSFYADSRQQSERDVAKRVEEILSQGGSMIDVGACSTRPDSEPVSESEERERLRWALMVVRREAPRAIVSVDTFRPDIARMVVEEFALTGFSVTSGIVSVDSEYISLYGADEATLLSQRVIRVDTSINSGNSGGGLYNSQGELMGLVDAKTSTTVAENAAYALPANTVKAVVESILSNYSGSNANPTKLNLGMTTSTKSSSATYSNETGLTTINEVVSISAYNILL